MKSPFVILGIGAVGLAVLISKPHNPASVNQCDLAVSVLGLTNDPGPSRPANLAVASGGKGLHVLFGVSNTSKSDALSKVTSLLSL